jgi:ABC-type Zn uptake system ZnuABC Zn-binding protein ZnuA
VTVHVSDGVELLEFGAETEDGERHDHEDGDDHEGERDHEGEYEGEHDHMGADPHVWTDPHSVMVWAGNIADSLGVLDPANADTYETNAQTYVEELEKLDEWIEEQVARVAPHDRQLVTDHTAFGYFAKRYGFDQVGAVIPGYSTLAEPSARELARLEGAIENRGVKAVFVGLTVNPDLARRVAEDTGTKLVFLYTGSLSEPDGPAGDYMAFMRYNVNAIVDALS